MHFRLFDRPLIVDDPLSRVYIDGQYEDYEPGSAYQGRVQIHGSVGFCKVRVLDSNIPPGAFVYIDQISREVVVKWPKYTPPVETFTLLENGDFSQGDTGSWTNTGDGTPFVIEPDSDGNMSLKFKSGYGGGHYVESPLAPVKNINRQITLTGKIAQGKSSKRKMWGGVVLVWHDEKRNVLNWNESNWINSGGGYKEARIVAAPRNPLTRYVSARVHFDRKGQNYPAWADDIMWDHVWEQGYDDDGTHFVEVEVTDALNNVTVHRGNIEITGSYLISQLYPISVMDYMVAGNPQDFRSTGKSTSLFEDVGAQAPSVLSVSYRSSTIRTSQDDPTDWPKAHNPTVVSASYQSIVKRYTHPFDPADTAHAQRPTVVSSTYRLVVKRAGNYLDSARAASPSIVGVTYR